MSSSQTESLVVAKAMQVKCTCDCECSDWCKTECFLNVKKHFVTWNLDKKYEKNAIKSPRFCIGKFQACLTMSATVKYGNNYWSIYLQILSKYQSFPQGKFMMKYSDYRNITQVHEMMIGADTFTQERGWGFGVNLSYNSVRVTSVFEYTFWLVEDDDSKSANSTLRHSQTLSTNYLQLLKDGEFSDVTLKVGGEVLKAHKNILASRSPVFAAMLKADLKSSEIVIKDIEKGVMKMLLKFIYSGSLESNCELNKDLMLDLLGAADTYKIPDLTAACSAALVKIINIDNVIQLFNEADDLDVDTLKTEAERFIIKNMGALLKTEAWQEMKESSPEEALEIIESAMNAMLKN